MQIDKQIIIIKTLLLSIFFVLSMIVQVNIIMPGFINLERQEAIKDMRRAVDALQSEFGHLDTLNWDWAAWDDTYEFIKDGNADYIESNLVLSTFTDNELNVIYLIDTEGKVVWGKAMDLETEEEIEISEFPSDLFPEYHPLLGLEKTNDLHNGILITSHGPMIISARAITTSETQGPVRGTIIMGRLLGEEYTKNLGSQTHTELDIWEINSDSMLDEHKEIIPKIDTVENIFVSEISSSKLHIYSLVNDIHQNPALLFKIDISRDISTRGKGISRYSFWLTISIGILLTLIFLFILRNSLISPLKKIAAYITNVGKSYDLYEEVHVEGCSEVLLIADEFNAMSKSLAKNRAELVDQSYHSGMSEITTGVIHNIRNTISPLVGDIAMFKEQFDDLPVENMAKAFEELRNNEIDPARKDKLTEFINLSLEHLISLKSGVRKDFDQMNNQVGLTSKLLDDLEGFAHAGFVPEKFKTKHLIADSTALFHNRFEDISIDIDLEDVETIHSHRSVLVLVFMNLLYNAGDAICASDAHGEGKVMLSVKKEMENGIEYAHFIIKDNGLGISAENISKIFERGFSTKGEEISGIGLHWCANTISTLQGRIFVESDGLGLGASFHVLLPLNFDVNEVNFVN